MQRGILSFFTLLYNSQFILQVFLLLECFGRCLFVSRQLLYVSASRFRLLYVTGSVFRWYVFMA